MIVWAFLAYANNEAKLCKCDLSIDGLQKIPIGKGCYVYRISSPAGYELIVESTTGGTVAKSIREARALFKQVTKKQVKTFLNQSVANCASAEFVKPDFFWQVLERSKHAG